MEPLRSAKDEVKQAADIVEVIGRYVQLRKAGQNYQGLCPFHSEKTPSFTVSPSKERFHCYGCKKGGDVFDFWMEYHHVSFPQALRDLAERYNISIPERTMDPAQKKRLALRDSLFQMNALACDYFREVLAKSKAGHAARQYLAGRGLSSETAEIFSLGYAPDTWNGFIHFLQKKGGKMGLAEKAGLILPRKQGGWYDRFRGRVVFPIHTTKNLIAGFGARVLDDSHPKYLNTPETPIFKKGEILYGLPKAEAAIRRSRRAVIVEGYTDVIALHQKGFREAVATLGTALTVNHLRRLKGYVDEVILVFDSDEAGRTAALKSLPDFLAEGMSARVLVLPDGEDPDSFVNKNGLEKFEEAIAKAIRLFDFCVETNLKGAGEGIESRAGILKSTLRVLAGLQDKTRVSLYLKRLAEMTGVPESVVLHEFRDLRTRPASSPGPARPRAAGPSLDEIHLLNLLVHYPSTAAGLLDLDWEILVAHPGVHALLESARKLAGDRGHLSPDELENILDGEEPLSLLRETLMSPPICPEESVEQAVGEYRVRIHEKAVEKITEAERHGDLERANRLLKLKQERERLRTHR